MRVCYKLLTKYYYLQVPLQSLFRPVTFGHMFTFQILFELHLEFHM